MNRRKPVKKRPLPGYKPPPYVYVPKSPKPLKAKKNKKPRPPRKPWTPKSPKSTNKDVKILYRNYYDSTKTSAGGVVTTSSNLTIGNFYGFWEYFNVVSESTPNYRSKKRVVNPPWHAYTKSFAKSHAPIGTYIYKAEAGTDVHISTLYCTACYLGSDIGVFPVSSEAADPTQKAIKRLNEDLQLQKANLAVTMGEIHKTSLHVAKTATRIFGALKALKSGRYNDFATSLGIKTNERSRKSFDRGFRKRYKSQTGNDFKASTKFERFEAKSSTKDFFARTWLEYSYGWKPLLKEVFDSAEALASVMVDRQGVVRQAEATAKERLYLTVKSDTGSERDTVTVSESYKYVKYVVQYRIPDGGVSFANAFGLHNPYLVAWELLPFSFVVDWFIPIGTALEALTSTHGLVFHRGTKSLRHRYSRKITHIVNGKRNLSGGVYYTGLSMNVNLQDVRDFKSRILLTSFPSYGAPKWKDPRSIAHAASAIALLQTIFLSSDKSTTLFR